MSFTTTPLTIIFYEKPGCAGNAKQKKVLQNQGLSFETRSILDTPWTKQTLEPFFQGLEKEKIFNPFAPKIKNKSLDIETLSKKQLIELMCEEPILIRRPLLEIGENKLCGFDIDTINKIFGSDISQEMKITTCKSSDPCTSA